MTNRVHVTLIPTASDRASIQNTTTPPVRVRRELWRGDILGSRIRIAHYSMTEWDGDDALYLNGQEQVHDFKFYSYEDTELLRLTIKKANTLKYTDTADEEDGDEHDD